MLILISLSGVKNMKLLKKIVVLTGFALLFTGCKNAVGNAKMEISTVNEDISLVTNYDEEAKSYTVKATSGFDNYAWYLDNELLEDQTSDSLVLLQSELTEGIYFIEVEAVKNSILYSASCELKSVIEEETVPEAEPVLDVEE